MILFFLSVSFFFSRFSVDFLLCLSTSFHLEYKEGITLNRIHELHERLINMARLSHFLSGVL